MTWDFEEVLAYYRETLGHEDDARRVAWRSRFDQELRFENLLEAIDLEGIEMFSVLDVGCGLGDLFGYLQRTGREVDYLGVDVVPEMIEEARLRHPEGRFEVRDVLTEPGFGRRFDLVLCSGGLTVRVERHERFVRQMLGRMLELCELAVAVNFQSTRAWGARAGAALNDADPLYHADPLAIYAVCRQLCRWTVLREDMLATDFTVTMTPGHSRSLSRYRRLPSPPPEAVGVGWLLLERRLPIQALEALDGEAPTAEVLNLRGMAWHQIGELKTAQGFYRRALERDGGYAPAMVNLETVSARLEGELGGQVEGEGRAAAELGDDADGAPVQAGELLDDGQAKADAAFFELKVPR